MASIMGLAAFAGAMGGHARGGIGPASVGEREGIVAFEVLGSHTRARAGEQIMLGLRFVMPGKWHVYWNGANDTGTPPAWALTLPEGWSAGEAMWPVPQRYVSPADTLDHVYMHEVVLLVPVMVGKNEQLGAERSIGVKASWLVCEDACIPEKGEGSVKVVVGEAPSVTDDRLALVRWQERVPAALEAKPIAGLSVVREGVDGRRVKITFAGADRLEFYPDSTSLPVLDILKAGTSTTGELVLEVDEGLATGDGTKLEDALRRGVFSGVVAVWTSAGVEARRVRVPEPEPVTDGAE